MGNPVNPRPIRLPPRQDYLIRQYAKKHGLNLNQAIIHLISKGLSIEEWIDKYRIEEFTENFFEKE
jgi:hypothetical protein